MQREALVSLQVRKRVSSIDAHCISAAFPFILGVFFDACLHVETADVHLSPRSWKISIFWCVICKVVMQSRCFHDNNKLHPPNCKILVVLVKALVVRKAIMRRCTYVNRKASFTRTYFDDFIRAVSLDSISRITVVYSAAVQLVFAKFGDNHRKLPGWGEEKRGEALKYCSQPKQES